MVYSIKKSIFFLVIFCYSVTSFAQSEFKNVYAKMQSGELIPIFKLGWFQHALIIYKGQNASKAITADWMVYSTPKFCPSSFSYHVKSEGEFSVGEKSKAKTICDNILYEKKLKFFPEEIKKICECKLVLTTESRSDGRAIWKSHDDEILRDEASKFSINIFDPQKNVTPALIRLGDNESGIYGFDGVQLCKYMNFKRNPDEMVIRQVSNFIRSLDRNHTPMRCLPDRDAEFDFGDLNFDIGSARFVNNSMKINFKNGEIYEVKINQ